MGKSAFSQRPDRDNPGGEPKREKPVILEEFGLVLRGEAGITDESLAGCLLRMDQSDARPGGRREH